MSERRDKNALSVMQEMYAHYLKHRRCECDKLPALREPPPF